MLSGFGTKMHGEAQLEEEGTVIPLFNVYCTLASRYFFFSGFTLYSLPNLPKLCFLANLAATQYQIQAG